MDRKTSGVRLAYVAAASVAALVLIALLSAAMQKGAGASAAPGSGSPAPGSGSSAPGSGSSAPGSRGLGSAPGCSSCSAPPAKGAAGARLDPVSDPVYNMVNICKQSVLLEEHLNNENKRCADCIKKHFLHIVGLAEEAVSLAGARVEPLMREAASTYDRLLRGYLDGADPVRLANECREIRKKLMARYVV